MNKANDWLAFAESNIRSAKLLFSESIYNEACFHAQQTAEKCLKAVLAKSGERIPKIHSLVTLHERTTSLVAGLSTLKGAFEFLEPFYMTTRYPDASPGTYAEKVPSVEEATQALEYATKIFDFVSSKISHKKTNQQGFAPIIAILLITITLLLGLVGYAYVTIRALPQFDPNRPSDCLGCEGPSTQTPTPTENSCDFSFIKHAENSQKETTTIDTKNNFQITYPSSWKWEVQNCNGFSYINNEERKASAKVFVDSSEKFGFYSDGKTAEDVVEGEYKPGKELLPRVEEKQIKVNNYPAKRFFEQMVKGDGPYEGATITGLTYLIAKDDKVYKFLFQVEGDGYDKTVSEVDKFIQTFK